MPADPPWKADRVLTLDDAREAIGSGFPEVDARDLRHLGSGWEFDAYLTGDGWVFRFPRRAEYAGAFDLEGAVHGLVAGPLAPVAVPRVELRGEPGPTFPYRFSGHRFIPGVGADDAAMRHSTAFAADLGAALRAIHAVPLEDAAAVGAPRETEGPVEWLREALGIADGIAGVDPAVDDAIAWLRGVDGPPPDPGEARFIHNDLGPEHVLLDPATGRLVGILDWTDAAIGDPAFDFAPQLAWGGRDLIAGILVGYGPPVTDAFLDRVRFFARLMALVWLRNARERGSDPREHVRWVRNAFDDLPPAPSEQGRRP